MSVWKEIRCDAERIADDCWSNTNIGPKGFEPVAQLHAEARRQGWVIRKGAVAICPKCRATQAERGTPLSGVR